MNVVNTHVTSNQITKIHTDRMTRRVGIYTSRSTQRGVFRACGYEYEDRILQEFETGDLVEPMGSSDHPGLRFQRMLQKRGLPGAQMRFGAPYRTLDRKLDILFAIPAVPADLAGLSTIRDWRRNTGFAACHLHELWSAELDAQLEGVEAILNQFDHVFCAMYHTVEVLQKRLSVPVSYMPWSIDAEAMCPYPAAPERVIDAISIGKLDPVSHDALWDWGQRTGRFYDFTTTGGDRMSGSHGMHRNRLVQHLQRSKYFFTFLAKREFMNQRGAQREFGLRYLEGAAAGVIQLGEPVPDNPGYQSHLDWEDAVIEAPFASAELPDLIESLEREQTRIEAARRRNVVNCLRRHDHVYRWAEVLEMAGMPESEAMRDRRSRLEALAHSVESGTIPYLSSRVHAGS